MNLKKASSSDNSLSFLSLANVSRTSESRTSLDKVLSSRFRMIPGHAGLAGVRSSTSAEYGGEGAAELAIGVGGIAGTRWDDRVLARFEEGGSSECRDLFFLEAGMFGRLDEIDTVMSGGVVLFISLLGGSTTPKHFIGFLKPT